MVDFTADDCSHIRSKGSVAFNRQFVTFIEATNTAGVGNTINVTSDLDFGWWISSLCYDCRNRYFLNRFDGFFCNPVVRSFAIQLCHNHALFFSFLKEGLKQHDCFCNHTYKFLKARCQYLGLFLLVLSLLHLGSIAYQYDESRSLQLLSLEAMPNSKAASYAHHTLDVKSLMLLLYLSPRRILAL